MLSADDCERELLTLAGDGFDKSERLGDALAAALRLRKHLKDAQAAALLEADATSADRRQAQVTRTAEVIGMGAALVEYEADAARLRVQLDDVYRRQDVYRTLASTARRLLAD